MVDETAAYLLGFHITTCVILTFGIASHAYLSV